MYYLSQLSTVVVASGVVKVSVCCVEVAYEVYWDVCVVEECIYVCVW